MEKNKLKIIYEDKNLLIVDKKAKLLTIKTDKDESKTLYSMASCYVKKQYPKNKVFIINRLDKETSGIVLFAKNQETKKYYQDNWDKLAKERIYIAIVEGRPPKEKDTLKSYLSEDKNLKVYKTNKNKGKLAITKYECLKRKKNYSLLKIKILTGRKNQIRVQLSDINNPIVGDKKYGAKSNNFNRLALHAIAIKLVVHQKDYMFITKVPKEFFLFKEDIDLLIANLQKRVDNYDTFTKNDC